MSILQHKREINLGRSEFSSLAFQIEMCRIQTDVEHLCNEDDSEDEKRPELINQVDSRICDFLRRIPQWKMDVGELLAYLYRKVARQMTFDGARHPYTSSVPLEIYITD